VIVRGGLVGLFDALASYYAELAKSERLARKRSKHQLALLHERTESQTHFTPAVKFAPSSTDAHGASPKSTEDVISALEESTRGFSAEMDNLAEALGGRLPGEPAPDFRPTGEGMPGLPNGSTMSSSATAETIDDGAAVRRIRSALCDVSDVPWLVEVSGGIIAIRAPKERADSLQADAIVLSNAVGTPFEIPQLFILPSRRTFFVDQIETRAHQLKRVRQDQPDRQVVPLDEEVVMTDRAPHQPTASAGASARTPDPIADAADPTPSAP
jgi:hypothetical protein